MLYNILSEKEHLKQNNELLELHKRCITDYLIQKSLKLSKRKKFFIIYDYYINDINIREYFFRPIKLFVYALITNRLEEIRDYIPQDKPNKKRKHASRKNL